MGNLAGGINLGISSTCIVRGARLDADCSVTGGANGGFVTIALMTGTADPEVEEQTAKEPKTACGTTLFSVRKRDLIKGWNLSGDIGFWDFEAMSLMFGGSTVLGESGGDFAGEVIGYADPNFEDTPAQGIYFEIITTTAAEGSGDCIASGTAPVAFGFIYPKVSFTPGSTSYQDDVTVMSFTGKSTKNPNLYNGPWNDFPGAGYIPNSPRVIVGYTQTEYDAILAAVAPGFVTLPAGS